MSKEKEPKKENRFLKLFKGVGKTFFPNKESVEEFKEKEKAKAEILIEAAQKMMRETRGTINDSVASYEGSDREVYLYDFLSEVRSGNGGFMLSTTIAGGTFSAGGNSASFDGDSGFDGDANIIAVSPNINGTTTVAIDEKNMEKLPPKRIYKPIEVFGELERVPTKVELENLDDKILVMKMKKEFIRNNQYAKKEVIDMITRLENRRKYEKYKSFFEKFDNTTTEKINDLLNKYEEIVLKPSDLFIPTIPDEAIKLMKEYSDTVKEMCDKKPIFYVIAEADKFKKENDRNDPILLVQSPFGIYWQIIGAWGDKDIILMSEL